MDHKLAITQLESIADAMEGMTDLSGTAAVTQESARGFRESAVKLRKTIAALKRSAVPFAWAVMDEGRNSPRILMGNRIAAQLLDLGRNVVGLFAGVAPIERPFLEAAKAFAQTHIDNDAMDAREDGDPVDDETFNQLTAQYNTTKAAMVAAFKIMEKEQ